MQGGDRHCPAIDKLAPSAQAGLPDIDQFLLDFRSVDDLVEPGVVSFFVGDVGMDVAAVLASLCSSVPITTGEISQAELDLRSALQAPPLSSAWQGISKFAKSRARLKRWMRAKKSRSERVGKGKATPVSATMPVSAQTLVSQGPAAHGPVSAQTSVSSRPAAHGPGSATGGQKRQLKLDFKNVHSRAYHQGMAEGRRLGCSPEVCREMARASAAVATAGFAHSPAVA